MNKVTSTIAVLAIGLIALIAYVVVTNQTGVEEDVNFQPQEVMMEEMPEENTSQFELVPESINVDATATLQ